LRYVNDSDPNNPDVAFNNGHLMFQTTFFIGEVNFYWKIGEEKFVTEMNTGDSNYITPFVPHSFTSRNPDAPGLIIAVTYSGAVRRALESFQQLGADDANALAGDLRDPLSKQSAMIARNRDAESLSIAALAQRLEIRGVEPNRAASLACGQILPSPEETELLAASLNVRPRDLIATQLHPSEEVVVAKNADSEARSFPDDNSPQYRLTELARTKHQPELKGFDVAVLGADRRTGEFRHGLHEYIYNCGESQVSLWWGENRSEMLAPGDSAYIQPMAPHGFMRTEGSPEGRLVMIRVPGAASNSSLDEYSGFAADRSRVAGESKRWF